MKGGGEMTADGNLEQAVPRVLCELVGQAREARATDMHLEPGEKEPRLRLRVNGLLYEMPPPPGELYPNLVARLKVLAELDVAEKRVPQSGYAGLTVAGRRVDMRVSTFPSIFGEGVAVRLLDRSNITLGFDRLGFSAALAGVYSRLIEAPYGMILVTGPTGGGKTTTLYASLNRIRDGRKKIITLEDPVEYHLDGIVQGQINSRAGFTFAEGLRSILRQDPDVVMVGEIRDRETAAIAMQISLTGQLVFATLHANTAPGAITRLLDMGLEPYLVGSSLLGVLNQTLVRHVCDECRVPAEPDQAMLAAAGIAGDTVGSPAFSRGQGCATCGQTGFRGRVGLYELMVVNRAISEAILVRPTVEQVTRLARENGLLSLRGDGLQKAAAGLTTLEDVLRVTRPDEAA